MFVVGTVCVSGRWFPCRIRKDRDKLYCTILETQSAVELGMSGLEIEFPRGDTSVRYNPKWAKNSMADEATDLAAGNENKNNADAVDYELESLDNVSIVSLHTGSEYTLTESTEIIIPPDYLLAGNGNPLGALSASVGSEGLERNVKFAPNVEGNASYVTPANLGVHVPFDSQKIQILRHVDRGFVQQRHMTHHDVDFRCTDDILSILRTSTIKQTDATGKSLDEDTTGKEVFVKKKGYKKAPSYKAFGCSHSKYEKIKALKKRNLNERKTSGRKVSRGNAWGQFFGCFR